VEIKVLGDADAAAKAAAQIAAADKLSPT